MTEQATPNATPRACQVCGAIGTLVPKVNELTEKRRVKFGVFWVLVSLISFGLGFVLWLVMPRKKVVVSVDRYMQCSSCGAQTR